MTDSYFLPFGPDVKLRRPFGVKPVDEWEAPAGEPIRAAGDGVVVFAGSANESLYASNFAKPSAEFDGDVVVLKMSGPDGPFFEYRNPSGIEVDSNDRVEGGQIIALAGEEDVHVGALPWRFNLGSRTGGRVNPRHYQTEYFGVDVVSAEEEPEDALILQAPIEEVAPSPAPSKRQRRANRTAPEVVEPTPVAEEVVPAAPVDATLSDAAPAAEPIDAGTPSED